MKVYPIVVYAEQPTGDVDRLGNAITESVVLDKDSKGRKAMWSDDQVTADPRILSQHLQKVVTTCKRATLEQATHVEVDGEKYQVDSIKGDDDVRWRIVTLIHWLGDGN